MEIKAATDRKTARQIKRADPPNIDSFNREWTRMDANEE